MASYRFLLASLTDGDVLAELPFESVTYKHSLNGVGEFTGTMGLIQDDRLSGILETSLNLGRVALYVERDGVIVWGGIPWTDDTDESAETYTLSGAGWLSYFHHRYLKVTKTYSQQDQVAIATDLLDYAIDLNGIAVVTSDAELTGVLRDRTHEGFERKNIGEEVEQLAALENGFDFRFESRWADGSIETRFLTQYPPTGRQTSLVFESGKQLSKFSVKTDATALASNVDGMGSGEGPSTLIASVANPAMLGQYPQYDAVIQHTDVSVFGTLDGHARKRLKRGSAPIVIPQVDWDPSMEPAPGSFLTGDIVRVRGGKGFRRFDLQARITEWSVTVDKDGGETGSISFAELGAFV